MGKEVVLIDFWPSMYGMRARIALAEKGVEYEHLEEDVHTTKSELLLRMNPVHKKVPVLIHNGRPVCESVVIVQYIDEVWSDKAPLMPSDPYHRAQARFWADYIDKKMDATKALWKTKGEEQEKAKVVFVEALKVLEEQALGEKPFFGGDEFGFLDAVVVPYYSWFYTFETVAKFKVEDSCPKIISWAKRCMQRESVAKSLPNPHKVYDYLLQLTKVYGV